MKKSLIPTVIVTTAILSMQTACAQTPKCAKPNDIVLTVGQYSLDLEQKNPVCVTAPDTFKIKIKDKTGGTVAAGDATVEKKNCSGLTIVGNNIDNKKKIAVNVGGASEKGYECEFLIRVKNVGVLDPRVRVVGSSFKMQLTSDAFYDTLDTLDLTVEEANKLIPPRDEDGGK